jgi:N-acetylneuraminic acid mutarotase
MGKDDDAYLTDFWKYDPVKNAWSQVADFPGAARAHNVSIGNGSKGFVGLGYDGDNDLSDFWEYDAGSDSWKQIDDFGGGERRYATAFAIDKNIYVGTGTQEDDKLFTNDFWKFDGNNWSKINSLSGEKRRLANAGSLNGKGYVFSGLHNSIIQDFWSYDPSTDVWTKLDDLNDEDTGNTEIARCNASTFSVDDKLYVVGGNSSAAVSTIFEWDPTTEIWTQKTSIEATKREGAGSFILAGNAYIVGGRSGSSYLDDCYMFEPNEEKNSDD